MNQINNKKKPNIIIQTTKMKNEQYEEPDEQNRKMIRIRIRKIIKKQTEEPEQH